MKIDIKRSFQTIKFPKIICNGNFIFGIKPYNLIGDKTTFKIVLYENKSFFENLTFIKEFDLDLQSPMVRCLNEKDNNIYLIIEDKINLNNLWNNISYLYIFDIKNLKLKKIKQLDNSENLLYFDTFNLKISSKIEKDEDNPNFFWGKYLFNFMDMDNNFYKPEFDDIVNYSEDKGHILHYIEESNKKMVYDFDNEGNPVSKKYFIIFSIRHKNKDNAKSYHYKIYSAYSDDLKYFYDTKEIEINNNLTDSKWYCYPEVLKKDNKYFVLLNQDDFGKEKKSLLGELIIE